MLAHARHVALLEHDLRGELGAPDTARESGFVEVALGVNADTLATWFWNAGEAFLTRERVLPDLRVVDQDVTHELLRTGAVAACISTRSTPFKGCRVLDLGRMIYRAYAAPAFAARYFPAGLSPATPREQLAAAPAVVFNREDATHETLLTRLFRNPPRIPRMYVPSSEGFLEPILRGLAYGMAPELQCADICARGELLDLAPDQAIGVTLYWHAWEAGGAGEGLALRLGNALAEAARNDLAPDVRQKGRSATGAP